MTPEQFKEWLCREMPAGTIIGDPAWWAPRIYEKAKAPPEAGGGISSGSAPQVHDVRSYDGEHGQQPPRPGHGTASDQRTTRAATDDPDLTGWTSGGIRLDRHPLISATYRLCLKAEAVPASEAATAASSAAWDLLRFIDKFLDEQAPVEPQGWQPIETAPADTDVLLYCPDRHYTNPERVELGQAKNTKGGSAHSWATHWMPLPSAPSTKAGS